MLLRKSGGARQSISKVLKTMKEVTAFVVLLYFRMIDVMEKHWVTVYGTQPFSHRHFRFSLTTVLNGEKWTWSIRDLKNCSNKNIPLTQTCKSCWNISVVSMTFYFAAATIYRMENVKVSSCHRTSLRYIDSFSVLFPKNCCDENAVAITTTKYPH